MTVEKRFACTACGMCCHGSVPLTIIEAVAMADRFPLAVSITPVRPGARGRKIIAKIGASVSFGTRKPLQLLITALSFVPPSMACPALAADNLCAIHDDKPVRCRAMPFYAFRDEDSQADMLVPRKDWLCATGEGAPVVYRDRKIVDRTDFDRERAALMEQTAVLQHFANLVVQHNPVIAVRIQRAAQTPVAGRVIVPFLSLLRFDRNRDLLDYARRQAPVLHAWAGRTSGDGKLTEFNAFYKDALAEIERYRS